MKTFRYFLTVTALAILSSCGSAEKKEPCRTAEEEPISTCRAIEKCQNQRSSVGVGVGVGIGRNFGIGISQSQSTEAYSRCIDRELKDQEIKSKTKDSGAGNGKPGQEPGLVQ